MEFDFEESEFRRAASDFYQEVMEPFGSRFDCFVPKLGWGEKVESFARIFHVRRDSLVRDLIDRDLKSPGSDLRIEIYIPVVYSCSSSRIRSLRKWTDRVEKELGISRKLLYYDGKRKIERGFRFDIQGDGSIEYTIEVLGSID